MKTYTKHHFAPWESRDSGLTSFGQLAVQEDEGHSHCTRCQVKVKVGRTGGVKFWVGGKWVSKRPPCEVASG